MWGEVKFRIGVLTGGGDVPGLNTCKKTIVHSAEKNNIKVIGIRRGWAGLLNYNIQTNSTNTNCISLNKANTRKIDRSGGTFLHTSRTNPSNLKKNEIPKFLNEKYQPSPGLMDRYNKLYEIHSNTYRALEKAKVFSQLGTLDS